MDYPEACCFVFVTNKTSRPRAQLSFNCNNEYLLLSPPAAKAFWHHHIRVRVRAAVPCFCSPSSQPQSHVSHVGGQCRFQRSLHRRSCWGGLSSFSFFLLMKIIFEYIWHARGDSIFIWWEWSTGIISVQINFTILLWKSPERVHINHERMDERVTTPTLAKGVFAAAPS